MKYVFLISFKNKFLQKSYIVNLTYEQLIDCLYKQFRNFNKFYSTELSPDSIEYIFKYIVDNYSINDYNKEYFVYLDIKNYIIDITITNKNFDYVYAYKQVIINDKYSGNCVTDFINRGIIPNISEISKYYEDILKRHLQRIEESNYHSSGTYEKDYSQIIKIRKLAEKIVNLCNDELIHLSDKYTK